MSRNHSQPVLKINFVNSVNLPTSAISIMCLMRWLSITISYAFLTVMTCQSQNKKQQGYFSDSKDGRPCVPRMTFGFATQIVKQCTQIE